ncbi:unnamed protein product [Rotaria sp. Silwood2]|nr:unnamed protein product [Rotaria sp. Silwood2]CAF4397380.1 unnamed protein product [Rotaria sp. Silwood2]CAF4660905.1 unnamed protein product [Rotaria sp. Silwood2]
MNPFIRQLSTFVRALSQSSIKLISVVPNARLPLLSPNLRESRPLEGTGEQTFEHAFKSFRGLFLLTGQYEAARYLILSYGECLRHYIIPNLSGNGKIARYNARDAVWWWLYSISNCTNLVPDGYEILSDEVSRLYPTDGSERFRSKFAITQVVYNDIVLVIKGGWGKAV